MDFKIKSLAADGVEAALATVERYRLLNEPWMAESICLDVLEVEPDNQKAVISLLLSLTDQFGAAGFAKLEQRAKAWVSQLTSEYQRLYYSGVIAERRGKAQLQMKVPRYVAYEAYRLALDFYERAEAIQPATTCSAVLRWNTCVRVIDKHRLEPHDEDGREPYMGD